MHKRQAKTLRTMPTLTRQIAVALNNLQTAIDRLDRRLPDIQNAELDSRAFWNRNKWDISQGEKSPIVKSDKAGYVT